MAVEIDGHRRNAARGEFLVTRLQQQLPELPSGNWSALRHHAPEQPWPHERGRWVKQRYHPPELCRDRAVTGGGGRHPAHDRDPASGLVGDKPGHVDTDDETYAIAVEQPPAQMVIVE
ncbi:MAG TPA: hypothetical protein VGO86_11055, partial [Candidatus Dormibacteraeota bacterium]